MGNKPLAKIKELKKYERKIDGSEIPPIYNLEKMGEIHREIDPVLRPFWENLHPIVQDFITAWNESCSSLIHNNEEMSSQLRQKDNLISNLKSNFEEKLRELNASLSGFKTDLQAKETALSQKELFITDLESTDKESKLGISQLRENLEKRLNKMNEEMAERQKKYEATQMQVGQAFQQKVLELDSEMLSLNEQLSEKDAKIKELEAKINVMTKENQKVKFYQAKVDKYENKIKLVADILEIESEEDEEED